MTIFRRCTCEWFFLEEDERNECFKHRPKQLDLRRARQLGLA